MVHPQQIQQQLAQAHAALAEDRYQQAHGLAMALLQADPTIADAYFIMAQIAHAHGKVAKAAEVVDRALRFAPQAVDYRLFRARCLLELNRQEAALEVLAALAPESLHSAQQLDTLGVLRTRLGQHELALPWFRAACRKAPGNAAYQYNLGASLQFSGHFAEAEAAYNAAIALQGDHYRAHFALSQLRRSTAQDNHLDRLQALWETLGEDPDARLHIGHALAREYEDLGDRDRAMHFLQAAKQRKQAGLAGYREHVRALFAAAGEAARRPGAGEGTGHPGHGPIFITGMPRTGTTLVERILASHSAVHSAGELATFSLLVKRQLGTPGAEVLDPVTLAASHRLDWRLLGADYLRATRHLTAGSAHFIDKMPFNFLYLPMIARALPDARLVLLRRNPMDTCLSNYRQLFATGFSYYRYSYDLAETAHFYAQFHRFADSLQALLGERLLQVSYEALVREPQVQVRRLLDHCGLPWEPGCLDFSGNTAPVATASAVQVREPLYQHASGRWRHYTAWLGDAHRELAAACIAHDWPAGE
jgi:tetratricopeptide (TPR) repeat protein